MNTKDDAIRRVLEKRIAVIEDHIFSPKSRQTPLNLAYYNGKRDGYQQAIDLLYESLESISIELE